MQDPDASNNFEAPDLLRRFIPTPVTTKYRVGELRMMVRTNDFTLLPVLPFDPDHDGAGEQNLEWTLIRDADSRGLLESPLFLKSGTLTVVLLGTACVVGLDHERRELFGFIGADIDVGPHQEFLIPLLCQMANEVLVSDPDSRGAIWRKEVANG
jgi:hypothetical protein